MLNRFVTDTRLSDRLVLEGQSVVLTNAAVRHCGQVGSWPGRGNVVIDLRAESRPFSRRMERPYY